VKKASGLIIAAIMVLAAVMTGCSSGNATSDTGKTTSASTTTSTTSAASITTATSEIQTYTDSSQSINANVNQEFIIALQSNPTTGYSWKSSFDSAVITQVKEEYKADEHEGEQIVGSGGTDYFTFKALQSGEIKIKFTYYRSWEQPTAADKTEEFTIVVK